MFEASTFDGFGGRRVGSVLGERALRKEWMPVAGSWVGWRSVEVVCMDRRSFKTEWVNRSGSLVYSDVVP